MPLPAELLPGLKAVQEQQQQQQQDLAGNPFAPESRMGA
jgi:hypothetical protein